MPARPLPSGPGPCRCRRRIALPACIRPIHKTRTSHAMLRRCNGKEGTALEGAAHMGRRIAAARCDSAGAATGAADVAYAHADGRCRLGPATPYGLPSVGCQQMALNVTLTPERRCAGLQLPRAGFQQVRHEEICFVCRCRTVAGRVRQWPADAASGTNQRLHRLPPGRQRLSARPTTIRRCLLRRDARSWLQPGKAGQAREGRWCWHLG